MAAREGRNRHEPLNAHPSLLSPSSSSSSSSSPSTLPTAAVSSASLSSSGATAALAASASLSDEQRWAVAGILGSRDFITIFQGGAGTGKSFTLHEVLHGLKERGHPVVVAAPQNQQSDDLRRDGMEGASTLARLLADNSHISQALQIADLQHDGAEVASTLARGLGDNLRISSSSPATRTAHTARTFRQLPMGAVVILDEAGQVGGKDMLALINAVRARNGRIILSGDTRQHGAVAAGDALRLLEKHTLLEPVRLKTVRRQDPDKVDTLEEKRFVRQYREAVEAASDGRLSDSFNTLDEAGCVRELAPEQRRETLAREYCAALTRGEKVLVVAPTWDEVREANAAIRERLVAEGKLGTVPEETTGRLINSAKALDSARSANPLIFEKSLPEKKQAGVQTDVQDGTHDSSQSMANTAPGTLITAWQSLDLSEAQKQDARFYPPNAKVFFVRQYGRFKKGDACEIAGFSEHGVKLRKAAPLRHHELTDGHKSGCDDERETTVSFQHADRFIVAKAHEIKVARGERLQMKFNGQSVEGQPIRNGELVTVRRVLADGRIVVRDDAGVRKTLKADQRLFVPGYAVTSYSSQGKTVDTVLVSYAGAGAGFAASAMPVNRHQWYVAISRARKKALVLTEDKEALRVRVEEEGNRESALSLVPEWVAGIATKTPLQTRPKKHPETSVKTTQETGEIMKSAAERAPEPKAQEQPAVNVKRQPKATQSLSPSASPANTPPSLSACTPPEQPLCKSFSAFVRKDIELGLQIQRQAMMNHWLHKPFKRSAAFKAIQSLSRPSPLAAPHAPFRKHTPSHTFAPTHSPVSAPKHSPVRQFVKHASPHASAHSPFRQFVKHVSFHTSALVPAAPSPKQAPTPVPAVSSPAQSPARPRGLIAQIEARNAADAAAKATSLPSLHPSSEPAPAPASRLTTQAPVPVPAVSSPAQSIIRPRGLMAQIEARNAADAATKIVTEATTKTVAETLASQQKSLQQMPVKPTPPHPHPTDIKTCKPGMRI